MRIVIGRTGRTVSLYTELLSDTTEDRVKADKDFCMKLLKDVVELQETDVKSVFRLGKRESANPDGSLQG